MFIPTWVFWVLYVIVIVVISSRIGRPKGNYDMFSPLLGGAILICGLVFMLAFFIGKYLG